MKRRDFLSTLAASGLALNLPFVSGNAHASSGNGRYFVVVNADGGWDPTALVDPKGMNGAYPHKSDAHSGSTNSVAIDASKSVGQIQWGAIPMSVSADDDVLIRVESQFDGFFGAHASRMTVLNGVDTGTNSHDVGSRHVWSGRSIVGYPAMSAYYAAAVAPTLPMAFLSNGGFDYTASTVARARASSTSFIAEVADANLAFAGRSYLHKDDNVDVYDMVKLAQEKRISRQISNESLDRRRRQLSQLFGVRSQDSNLSELIVHLEDLTDNVSPEDYWNAGRASALKKQAQLVAAAFKANLAVSANLNLGGFDTHHDHDSLSYPLMGDLLEGINYLLLILDYLGIREQTTVVVGSDFGRSPYYNPNMGKDHWPVTSMMILDGAGAPTGGKVFGESTADFNSQKVNLSTGVADENGLVLEPAHVNQELRKLLGVADHPLAELFPLPESNFNIFV